MEKIEIERKFLVKGDFTPFVTKSVKMAQGYISSQPTVRIRIANGHGLLTIKGKSQDGGLSRYEWEKEITRKEAEKLIRLSTGGIIEKIRHYVPAGSHTYEVDEFEGANRGLVIAEIELGSAEETFQKPAWLGEEVTGVLKYYNAYLSANPYSTWDKEK